MYPNICSKIICNDKKKNYIRLKRTLCLIVLNFELSKQRPFHNQPVMVVPEVESHSLVLDVEKHYDQPVYC